MAFLHAVYRDFLQTLFPYEEQSFLPLPVSPSLKCSVC